MTGLPSNFATDLARPGKEVDPTSANAPISLPQSISSVTGFQPAHPFGYAIYYSNCINCACSATFQQTEETKPINAFTGTGM
jgi:hypothetical protein